MLSIKIVGLPEEEWGRAGRLAGQFLKEFPERIGAYHGCIYSNSVGPDLYVYKTKTLIVVRKTNETRI